MDNNVWQYPLTEKQPPPVVEVEKQFKHLTVRSVNYQKGHIRHSHRHRWGQLIYAVSGLMTVNTEGGIWFVPPGRAVWVPVMQVHSVELISDIAMCSAYFDGSIANRLSKKCRVIQVSPALKELIDYVAQLKQTADTEVSDAIATVMAHLIEEAGSEPLGIAIPSDTRLRTIYEALINNPDNAMSLEEWATQVGSTGRTLTRKLMAEVQLNFSTWRQQIRLLRAIDKLSLNQSITNVALDVGFASASAFITAFRKNFGLTPKAYLKSLELA